MQALRSWQAYTAVHTLPLMFSLRNWKRQLLIGTHLISTVSDKVEIAWLTPMFHPCRVRCVPWITSWGDKIQWWLQRQTSGFHRRLWTEVGLSARSPRPFSQKGWRKLRPDVTNPTKKPQQGHHQHPQCLDLSHAPQSPFHVHKKFQHFSAWCCDLWKLSAESVSSQKWSQSSMKTTHGPWYSRLDTSTFCWCIYLYTRIFTRWMAFINSSYLVKCTLLLIVPRAMPEDRLA